MKLPCTLLYRTAKDDLSCSSCFIVSENAQVQGFRGLDMIHMMKVCGEMVSFPGTSCLVTSISVDSDGETTRLLGNPASQIMCAL